MIELIYRQRIGILLFVLVGSTTFSFAQTERLKVYIDCRCDMNYMRQELNYIDHVRDQGMADVQLFINDIRSGNGGRTYDLNYIGKDSFEQIKKELRYQTSPTMTRDEVRTGLAEKIAFGLLPYLLESGQAEQLNIKIGGSGDSGEEAVSEEDPWNNWIFEVRGDGELNKESSRNSTDVEFGFEADRVTEDWRISLDMEFSHSESHFESDEEEFVSIRQSYYAFGRAIRSLGDHWSTGIFSGIHHSTYRNLDLSYSFRPAIEYSLFPYSEVIRREITFSYRIGYVHNNYIEKTIYDKTSEDLFNHSFNIGMRFRQPWGDIFTSIEASSYLHDFSKNSIDMFSYVSVRVFKGLAVRFSANLELVRDQLNLPAGDASIEDVLLRQRQIATDFEMGIGVGLSYTFGSAFNNIVNTRL